MDWTCTENEARFVTKNCTYMHGHQKGKGRGAIREKPGEQQLKERDAKWGSGHG